MTALGAAPRTDFTMYRGAARTLKFAVTNDDGSATDVTAWTTVFTLRAATITPDPPAITKSGTIVGPAANGIFQVVLTEADTLALTVRSYVYSFTRTNSVDVLAEGVVSVRSDILNQV